MSTKLLAFWATLSTRFHKLQPVLLHSAHQHQCMHHYLLSIWKHMHYMRICAVGVRQGASRIVPDCRYEELQGPAFILPVLSTVRKRQALLALACVTKRISCCVVWQRNNEEHLA